jgi:N-formylglutamate amidohydrolase
VPLGELLVVIPHSGIIIPNEIPLESLARGFPELVRNVDWYTNWLYDFRDMLDNKHLVFPYCSLIVEGNRHPAILDDSVPLYDVRGQPVYKDGLEPSEELRRRIAKKYLLAFHKAIEENIIAGAEFLFDGHSTVAARGVADNQIDLMNFQHSHLDKQPKQFCPDLFVETYAAELSSRLPDVNITINSSEYFKVYGHICAEHSVNAMGRVGNRVPALIQETNERLYKNPDRTPNVEAINRLRTAFAESIQATFRKVRKNG